MDRVCTIFVTGCRGNAGPVVSGRSKCRAPSARFVDLPGTRSRSGHLLVLSASPELMGLAVKRFEDYWEKQS